MAMRKMMYIVAVGFCLSTLAACGNANVRNANEETSPGVTGGGTGAGTTASGVGTSGTPGSLTDVGDTIRTTDRDTTRNR